MTPAVAVVDIGITHLKLDLVDSTGAVTRISRNANVARSDGPYLHMDVESIWDWLLRALTEANDRSDIEAIVPCTHGSAAALIDRNDLVLPIMHYEAQPPPAIVEAYGMVAPGFTEVLAPVNPGGLTLARQLFWQQTALPDAFRRASHLLTYPQYWAWRLCGERASEVTSLGAQTHLWAPLQQTYSSLVDRLAWRELFPPRRNAWEPLGGLRGELARITGIRSETPILCGIHDSNANYLRYLAAGLEDFSLMSTGTWIINFNSAFDPAELEPQFDTNTNSDVRGRPVACSRFMGGREHAALLGDGISQRATASLTDLQALIDAEVMAIPSFSDSGGPFPGSGGRGRVVGPRPTEPSGRIALAALYTALMANSALARIGTNNAILIDGVFAGNTLFCELIAALHRERKVWVAAQADGTAAGAAQLWQFGIGAPTALDKRLTQAADLTGLERYRARWENVAREVIGRV